jgi:hypothetical protein
MLRRTARHACGHIRVMNLTSNGRRAVETALALRAQAERKMLREPGTKAWGDARRRLTRLLRVAVRERGSSGNEAART